MALNDTKRLNDQLELAGGEIVMFESTDNVALNMASGTGYPGSAVLRVPIENMTEMKLLAPSLGIWRTIQSWFTGATEVSQSGESDQKQVKRAVTFLAYPIPQYDNRLDGGAALSNPASVHLEFKNGRDAFTVFASHQQLLSQMADKESLPPSYF